MNQLEQLVSSVYCGIKRIDVEVEIDGTAFETTCYRVPGTGSLTIRVDLKPKPKRD